MTRNSTGGRENGDGAVVEKLAKLGDMMSRDIFVVCLDLSEYKYLLSECYQQLEIPIKAGQVHYISAAKELIMASPARVILWGKYFKRPDWDECDKIIIAIGHRRLLIR